MDSACPNLADNHTSRQYASVHSARLSATSIAMHGNDIKEGTWDIRILTGHPVIYIWLQDILQ